MAKKPEQRFQSPAELVAELSFFFGSGVVQAAPTPSTEPAMKQPAVRPPAASSRPEIQPIPHWAAPKIPAADVFADQDMPRTLVVPPDSLAPSITPEPPVTSATFAGDTQNDGAASSAPFGEPSVQPEIVVDGRQGPKFLKLWRRWTAIVDALVERRDPSISEAEYGVLHADLLGAAQSKGNGECAQAVYGMVESAVAPWLTLRSLHQTDPQTLASLRLRCGQLEQKLNLNRPAYRLIPWAAAALMLLAVSLVVFLAASSGSLTPRNLALSSLKEYATAHPFLTLALSVPPMVLGSVYFLSRFTRS